MNDFSLYPIYGISGLWGQEQKFDVNRLPFELIPGVAIEDVSGCFTSETFKYVLEDMGTRAVKTLRETHYALVHRYKTNSIDAVADSEQLIRKVAACLRLIRPMRQYSNFMQGVVKSDGTFDVTKFQAPADLEGVPEIQALFLLRDQDANDLRAFLPEFLKGMGGNFWKFRMSVQFHELGFWAQDDHWKARYLLWASAIESIYTSHKYQGSALAKKRIRWFLGESTSIYSAADLADEMLTDPQLTIGLTVDDLYKVRTFVAHGDRLPDHYFQTMLRQGRNGGVSIYGVLFEVQSFIIRNSLLKILREGLLDHFAGADEADAYFKNHGLDKI